MEITPASVRTYPEYWQLLYKQADFRTQQLVAERGEAVGTRRSRRRPGRDQQIGIVLPAANSDIASPPLE